MHICFSGAVRQRMRPSPTGLICHLCTRPAAAAGRHHSLAFTREGEAWAWGLNQSGQLGIGSIKKAATKLRCARLDCARLSLAAGRAVHMCWDH
jgi:alpha-tubulin suppressor-like RCC1 family protein